MDNASYLQQREAARRVPLEALDGSFCGIACEVCPLRRWKSSNPDDVLCTDILEAERKALENMRAVVANQ